MELSEIYLKHKDTLNNIKCLFMWYDKYYHCISIRSYNDEVNETVKKVSRDYYKLMLLISTDIAVNDSANGLFRVLSSEYVNDIKEGKSVFIDHILSFIDQNKDIMTNRLSCTDDFQKNAYLYSFEEALTNIQNVTTRMKMMIGTLQNINVQHLQTAA